MNTLVQEFDPAVPVGIIEEHPENPRRGDDRVVAQSIERNGFFGAILIQRSSKYIIAGNTRYRAMRDDGETTIPAFWVDCDDATAKRIMLADNRTSDLAFYDDQQLFALLKDVMQADGLDGTGYDRAAYELLLQSVESDHIIGGVRQGLPPEERLDTYVDLDVRSLILPYAGEVYEAVAAWFAVVRQFHGLDSNADVAAYLVEKEVKEIEGEPSEA